MDDVAGRDWSEIEILGSFIDFICLSNEWNGILEIKSKYNQVILLKTQIPGNVRKTEISFKIPTPHSKQLSTSIRKKIAHNLY